MQLDDDVFFAELSKRISLLITDDDEADFGSAQFPASLPVPVSRPSLSPLLYLMPIFSACMHAWMLCDL